MRKCVGVACFLAVVAVLVDGVDASITLGQVDTFQGLDTMGWDRGPNSPTPPFLVTTGGPLGVNDGFVENTSTGTTGSNSHMSMFNQEQWTGDYIAAGVTTITAQMANFGSTTLYMRIAIQDQFGTEYGSTDASILPADGRWHPISFDMTAMTLIQGPSTLSDSLTNVGILRLISHQEGVSYVGDTVQSAMGLDDVTAVPEPVVLTPLIGIVVLGRRRASR